MNSLGEPYAEVDLLVRSRSALLDVLVALDAHRAAVIVVGAQAIHLRTTSAPVALAESTKDSDLAIDPRLLADDPLIEVAMATAHFMRDPASNQPCARINQDGIPVDLMVPSQLAGKASNSQRGARIPPHDRRATRRARGLEAAVVDNDLTDVGALDEFVQRVVPVRVAGLDSLIVAKAHKIGERAEDSRHRLVARMHTTCIGC
jgi:hypothetical protein